MFFSMTRSQAVRELSPIAAEQGGLISAAQARLVGVDRRLLTELTRAGYLQHLRHGAYAFAAGRAPDRFEDVASAWLAVAGTQLPWSADAAPDAIVSHASAAQIHGIGTIIPGVPELTQPRQRTRRSDVTMHTARIDRADWQWTRLGSGLRLPVTTPARTIVDLLLAHEEMDYLHRATRDAFDDPTTARAELLASLQRRRKPGANRRHRAEPVIDQLAAPDGFT
jgi:predicted transcriptional regulator of viral defense system